MANCCEFLYENELALLHDLFWIFEVNASNRDHIKSSLNIWFLESVGIQRRGKRNSFATKIHWLAKFGSKERMHDYEKDCILLNLLFLKNIIKKCMTERHCKYSLDIKVITPSHRSLNKYGFSLQTTVSSLYFYSFLLKFWIIWPHATSISLLRTEGATFTECCPRRYLQHLLSHSANSNTSVAKAQRLCVVTLCELSDSWLWKTLSYTILHYHTLSYTITHCHTLSYTDTFGMFPSLCETFCEAIQGAAASSSFTIFLWLS